MSMISSMTPYPYLDFDYVTPAALYVHHHWLASFCVIVIGAGAHFGFFNVRHGVTLGQDNPFGGLLFTEWQ